MEVSEKKMREIVVRVAKRGETIFIDDLCKELGMPITPKNKGSIGKPLARFSVEECEKGRGMISVVVISKRTGLPWEGFFANAKKLGLMAEEESNENFFGRELNRVHSADWGAE